MGTSNKSPRHLPSVSETPGKLLKGGGNLTICFPMLFSQQFSHIQELILFLSVESMMVWLVHKMTFPDKFCFVEAVPEGSSPSFPIHGKGSEAFRISPGSQPCFLTGTWLTDTLPFPRELLLTYANPCALEGVGRC